MLKDQQIGLRLMMLHAPVCVGVCVCLYLPHTKYQDIHFTSKVRTFSECEDIVAAPPNVSRLFEG